VDRNTFTLAAPSIIKYKLFNVQRGKCSPIKCMSFLSERENALQWAFQLNSALAAARSMGFERPYSKG
jgi:hypothetical protein